MFKTFQAMTQGAHEYPLWFSGGKTSLIPKPGEFASDNQRPITCSGEASFREEVMQTKTSSAKREAI